MKKKKFADIFLERKKKSDMLRQAITQLSKRATQKPLAMVPKRTYFQNGPPKYPISAWEWTFGMLFISIGGMAPTGWIISHLEDYRGVVDQDRSGREDGFL